MVRSMDGAIAHLDRVANFKNRLESMLTSSAKSVLCTVYGVSAFAQGPPVGYGFYSSLRLTTGMTCLRSVSSSTKSNGTSKMRVS